MATITEMRQVANQIENATIVGENSAQRVGGLFNDVVDKLEPIEGVAPFNVNPTRGSTKGATSGGIYSTTPTNADSSSNADLTIEDETSNVLVKFKDGQIQTKEFNSEDISNVKIEGYSDGDFALSDGAGNVLAKLENGHIKTKYFDSENASRSRYFDYTRRTFFVNRVDVTNYLVNNFVAQDVNTHETPVYYDDNCVLYLPMTYTKDGEPTKVVIFCKDGATTIEPNADTVLTGVVAVRYLLHIGYAVLAADGMPNGWVSALGLSERVVGNYVALQSTIRAWQYVSEHYNIDKDGAYIFGYSQGGHYAQNVIDNSGIPIIAAAELSPACSMRFHQWDLAVSQTIGGVTWTRAARLNIARIFDYPEVTTNAELLALDYDAEKVEGFDPWTRNVDEPYEGFVQSSPYGSTLWCMPSNVTLDDITMKKYLRCPLKVWAAENDNRVGADVMKVFVKAVKNAGQVADMQLYSTGAHSVQSSQSAIGTFVENGQTVNIIPLSVDVAYWFYRFGGYAVPD